MRQSLLQTVCGGLASIILISWPCTPARADESARADFYVAPSGSDTNPGTLEAPFATLARARDGVRQRRQAGPSADVRVLLRGGTYRLRETVVFGLQDSAPPDGRVTYAAYPGERPLFTSGVPLARWNRVEAEPTGAAEVARGHLWWAEVPAGIANVVVLFDGEHRLPRARSRGFRPLPATDAVRGSRQELRLPPDVVPIPERTDGLELLVVPTYPWVMNILPIAGHDPARRVLQTEIPATYPLGGVRFGHFASGSAWIENAIGDLDEPGEWVFDAAARRILLWPPEAEPSNGLSVPALTELIRVEGSIDEAGPVDQPVRGLVFRGLHFTQGDRFAWEKDRSGRGLQHDWEMFDRPTALVRLRGAEDCTVEACRFTNSGGAGIRLDLHARGNAVRENLFAHLGGTGILLAGYGPGTKDVNRGNTIEGNHVHHVGELLWHSPGIFAWQSGENRIRGNLVHHCPYTAIVVSGRIVWDRSGAGECSATIRWSEVEPALAGKPPLDWRVREPFLHGRRNTVEGNEIHDVMEILGDGNCIYVSGTGAGNLVRGNYLHDVASPNMNAAIRCDDDQHETTITGNLVWRTCGEGFIFKGKNTITQNVVADLRTCRPKDERPPRGFLVLPYGDVSGAVVRQNVFYCTEPAMKVMTEGGMKNNSVARLRDCQADRNLYFCRQDPEWGRRHVQEQCRYGVECESRVADPGFVDAERGDFRLRADSAAREMGIEAPAVSPIGRSVFPFNE